MEAFLWLLRVPSNGFEKLSPRLSWSVKMLEKGRIATSYGFREEYLQKDSIKNTKEKYIRERN